MKLLLTEWRDFFVMIGTASGVIVGANFIVASLLSNAEKRAVGMRGFITPIAVHLGSVLVGSAVLCVPVLTANDLAVLLGAGGLAGAVYGVVVAARIWPLNLDIADRAFYGVAPVLAYAAMAAAALMSEWAVDRAFELLAATLVALLVIGMRNAWDMASFMIMRDDKN